MAISLNRERINTLIAEQEDLLNSRTQKSREMYGHASQHLSGGVASSYQSYHSPSASRMTSPPALQ